jgi:phycoerythrin-associated linker protein
VVSTFINPVVNPDAKLGVGAFDRTAPIRLWENHSEAEADVVIRAAYRQVFGNAHVMESERLISTESQLKRGNISVREFVRQIAQSEIYRSLFFENCSRMRSIELNFKHLLGRAPESYEEVVEHSQYLDQDGFEAEIDSYIDSDEYEVAFGEDTIPYFRGYKTQTGRKIVGFTHMQKLLRGSASSDKVASQNRSKLNSALMRNHPNAIAPVVGARSNVTDFNQLLAKVLGIKAQTPSPAYIPPASFVVLAQPSTYAVDQALLAKAQEQTEAIAILQTQLAELRPFASIGTNLTKSDWQPSLPASCEESSSLQEQVDAQTTQISALQDQISEARRYASIGEGRLNKWRSRVFNS